MFKNCVSSCLLIVLSIKLVCSILDIRRFSLSLSLCNITVLAQSKLCVGLSLICCGTGSNFGSLPVLIHLLQILYVHLSWFLASFFTYIYATTFITVEFINHTRLIPFFFLSLPNLTILFILWLMRGTQRMLNFKFF